jgi:proton-coupled amino acid transporter
MAAFSFEGIAVVIPLYKQLNNKPKFRYIFRTAIFLVCGIYIGFAHLNYIAYGSNTQPMITFNLPESSIIVQMIIIAYILILVPSILIQFFPAIRVMEQRYVDPNFTGKKRTIAINILRGFVMVANLLLAVIFGEKFDLFLSLIGSLTCVPLGISIPGLLHLKLQGKRVKDKIIDIGLVTIGVIITIMTSGISIYKYIKKDSIG